MSKKFYGSIDENLLDTGLHQAIFRKAGGSSDHGLRSLAAADLENLEAFSDQLKAAGSLGSLAGERVSDDLLRDVAQHASNPFKLERNGAYEVTPADHFVMEYGSLDGERTVWEQLVVPNLTKLGISRDPGLVPPTPGRPDEGNINKPLPINDQDPAVKALYLAIDALRALSGYHVIVTLTADVPPKPVDPPVVKPITETEEWHRLVLPILAGPFMSPAG